MVDGEGSSASEQVIVARAFCRAGGAGGNAVRVHLCAGKMPAEASRQAAASRAKELGTAFVELDGLRVALHNPAMPRPFVAHSLLGVLEVLARRGLQPDELQLETGSVRTWSDADGRRWVRAPASWSPNDRHRQVERPSDVDALNGPPPDEPVQVWAWIDETRGVVRARQFAPSEGKPEDEACGSASMVLAAGLDRPLEVHHGRASLILVRPDGEAVGVGGHCIVETVTTGH